jgi:hypothetical protein
MKPERRQGSSGRGGLQSSPVVLDGRIATVFLVNHVESRIVEQADHL